MRKDKDNKRNYLAKGNTAWGLKLLFGLGLQTSIQLHIHVHIT